MPNRYTYTIPAPRLEPKEKMFVGYEQPYAKIRYEIDFALGADVDIGCGTAVVGDGRNDVHISKDRFAHPLSMNIMGFQFPAGPWKSGEI